MCQWTLHYLYNGHGGLTALVDGNGTAVQSYYYDAFGVILEQSGSAAALIAYAGYQYDDETGLFYVTSRMYDPKIARFMQEDTYCGDTSDPLSLNLYAYVGNNPLIYTDPTGHTYTGYAGDSYSDAVVAVAIANGVDMGTAQSMVDYDVRNGTNQYGTQTAISQGFKNSAEKASGSSNTYSDDSRYSSGGVLKDNSKNEVKSKSGDTATVSHLEDGGSIIISGRNVLLEGEDYYIGPDGKPYYYISGNSSAPIPANSTKKNTSQVEPVALLQYDDFIAISDSKYTYYGGLQDWFDEYYKYYGGCGTVAAANILAYMAMTNPSLANLLFGYDYQNNTISKDEFTKFMEEVYEYVKPTEVYKAMTKGDVILGIPPSLGVDSMSAFVSGVIAFAKNKGIELEAVYPDRPVNGTVDEWAEYIKEALSDNIPVALFETLNSIDMQYERPTTGKIENQKLSKHWITITGIGQDSNTGEYFLLASSWGGSAMISLNDYHENRYITDLISMPGLVYFKQVTHPPYYV